MMTCAKCGCVFLADPICEECSALPPVKSEPLLAELFADLQRIDKTSILPDGDWVSVCVATWAAEWVKRLKDAGLITANAALTGGEAVPSNGVVGG